MIATSVSFGLPDVLLLAAIVLFVLSIGRRLSRGFMVPIGLACFAASFLSFVR